MRTRVLTVNVAHAKSLTTTTSTMMSLCSCSRSSSYLTSVPRFTPSSGPKTTCPTSLSLRHNAPFWVWIQLQPNPPRREQHSLLHPDTACLPRAKPARLADRVRLCLPLRTPASRNDAHPSVHLSRLFRALCFTRQSPMEAMQTENQPSARALGPKASVRKALVRHPPLAGATRSESRR